MEQINKLRDKYVDKYVVSATMEERERISLLDNLATSVEKVEEEAKLSSKSKGMKVITDQQESVVELCGCLLAILSHELKIIHMKENPSFWLVAEHISPKDIIKMIYRLGIRQSDDARCQVWVRHALAEGTIGSYFTLLEEDSKILKHSYRTSAFVRDLQKMEAAKSIINNVVASVNFKIKIENIVYNDTAKTMKRTLSSSSVDRHFVGQHNKDRESPDNIATIKDSDQHPNKNFVKIRPSDTFSLPGDILQSKRILRNQPSMRNERSPLEDESLPRMSPTFHKSPTFSGSETNVNHSNCEGSPVYTDSEKRVDIEATSVQQREDSDISSENSLTSSSGSGDESSDAISDDNVIVNSIRIISDEGSLKTSEDNTLVFVKESSSLGSSFHDSKFILPYNENDIQASNDEQSDTQLNGNSNRHECGENNNLERQCSNNMNSDTNQAIGSNYNEGNGLARNTKTIDISDGNRTGEDKGLSEMISSMEHCNEKQGTDSINTCENLPGEHPVLLQSVDGDINPSIIHEKIENVEGSEINSQRKTVERDAFGFSHECDTENSSERLKDDSMNDIPPTPVSSHPTLNICGSLTHSQTSAFKVVKKSQDTSSDAKVIPSSTNRSEDNNELIYDIFPETIEHNVSHDKDDECIYDTSESKDLNFQITRQTVDNWSSLGNVETKEECHSQDEENMFTQTIDDLSSSSSESKTEEGYRNQVNAFHKSVPVEGSSQLANVLSNVTDHNNSIYDDYFVPGIHDANDIQNSVESRPVKTNLRESTGSRSISSSLPTPYKNPSKELLNTEHVSSSPRSFSALSSKLLEKTGFKRSGTLSSSLSSSDKAFDDERLANTDSGSECSAGQSYSLLAELGVTDDVIGMKEDHFSTPDSFMGFSSLEELENAIASCKHLINASPEKSPHRDELVAQLVKLRLKLHEARDNDVAPKQGKLVLGHQFFKHGGMSSTLECDACATTIFPLLQNVFLCKDCGFHCHKRCLKILEKPCVHNSKLNSKSCELRICPEVPLSAQQYRCADCFQRISMNDGQFDARLCDYTGQKYCTKCHWNDTFIIPARVVSNWDFSCYKVSRQSKHLLIVLSKKPDINLQTISSSLFSFVDELRDVRTLRQQIMMMKKYITTCRIATEQRLLLLLQSRQHFVDSSDLYSLQDLIDIHNNVLLNELSRVHAIFGKHIKFDCLLCQGKGFICEFCNGEEIIFPFDNHVVSCCCKGIFHRLCYTPSTCPKCKRIAKKKLSEG